MIKRILKTTCKCFLFLGVITLCACQKEKVPDASDAQATVAEWLKALPLQSGEELAILHTNMGDIKVRFFPSEAPKAVENFVTHAKNGYYNGVIFHRVIQDFMIQGGDPEGTGMGGESIWGEGFGPEFSLEARHFRGALSMAQSQIPNSIGSQFFIVQNKNLGQQFIDEFNSLKERQDEYVGDDDEGNPRHIRDVMPVSVLDHYINHGGTPFLDLVMSESGHTVFGHVVEGMDVVDAIAATPVDSNDRPRAEVVINRVSFEMVP